MRNYKSLWGDHRVRVPQATTRSATPDLLTSLDTHASLVPGLAHVKALEELLAEPRGPPHTREDRRRVDAIA